MLNNNFKKIIVKLRDWFVLQPTEGQRDGRTENKFISTVDDQEYMYWYCMFYGRGVSFCALPSSDQN